MPDVILKPINETVEVPSGQRLLDVLLEKNCPVMMACGGQAICATCHVYIEDGHDSVNPKSDRENRTLALITGARANSRLSCQCRVEGPGPVTVLLPEGLYVESVEEIETYIGKRTNIPIRHPRDGRVLIAPGKIITRTRIMELNDTDFSLFDFDLEQ